MIHGVVLERITNDMNKMDNRYEEGMDVAHDVMYMGRGYTPDLNMERRGLFIHNSPEAPKAKRKISAEGMKNIIAATKKRWKLKKAWRF